MRIFERSSSKERKVSISVLLNINLVLHEVHVCIVVAAITFWLMQKNKRVSDVQIEVHTVRTVNAFLLVYIHQKYCNNYKGCFPLSRFSYVRVRT